MPVGFVVICVLVAGVVVNVSASWCFAWPAAQHKVGARLNRRVFSQHHDHIHFALSTVTSGGGRVTSVAFKVFLINSAVAGFGLTW